MRVTKNGGSKWKYWLWDSEYDINRVDMLKGKLLKRAADVSYLCKRYKNNWNVNNIKLNSTVDNSLV